MVHVGWAQKLFCNDAAGFGLQLRGTVSPVSVRHKDLERLVLGVFHMPQLVRNRVGGRERKREIDTCHYGAQYTF